MKDYKEIFRQRQNDFLWIINTEAGREFVGVDPERKEKIVKVFPNGYDFYLGSENGLDYLTSHFFHYDRVAEKLLLLLDTLDIVKESGKLGNPNKALLHYTGFKKYNYPQILHTTVVFSSPGLAGMVLSSSNTNYATVRAGFALSTGAPATFYNYFDGTNYALSRTFTTWDTSSITDVAIILSAFERIVGNGATVNTDTNILDLVPHTSASNVSLSTSDWGNIGTTVLGSIAFNVFVTGGNNDLALNASGIAAINLTGYTKIGIRTDKEIAATPPTAQNHVTFDSTTGYLSVTYSVPGGLFYSIP